MGYLDRLMLLLRRLRHPYEKAPVDVHNGERLDAVEQRLDLIASGYRRADEAWRK